MTTTISPKKKNVIFKERMFLGLSSNFQTHRTSRMPRMTWKLKGELKFSQRMMKVLMMIGRARISDNLEDKSCTIFPDMNSSY